MTATVGRCKLNIPALSAAEWNYLRGLFLADGYSQVRPTKSGGRAFDIQFYLQAGEEKELAFRLRGLLRRAGMNPRVWKHSSLEMITVQVYSKALLEFLPDKESLASVSKEEEFLEHYRLSTVEYGIPFLAGLIDGDGSCQVHIAKHTSSIGTIKPWDWSLGQSKYPFLIEYAREFVESLARDSVRVWVDDRRANNSITAVFRKRGILALLNTGITKYSWKTVRWLRRLGEARRERAKYLTTGQAARVLDISVDTVKKLLESREMEYFRGKGYSTRRFILTADVQKLKETLLEKRREMRAVESKGMEFKEVSRLTSIPFSTLHKMCKNGELQATLTHLIGQGRRWIIPRNVVEKLKQAGSDHLKKSRENETLSKMTTEI